MAYVCYRKLSKKKRKEIDQAKRGTWGNVSPVTKKTTSAKVYNRKKAQRQHREMGRWVLSLNKAMSACYRVTPITYPA